MSFEQSPFAKSLYQSGSPSKVNTPKKPTIQNNAPVTPYSNIIPSNSFSNSSFYTSPLAASANSTFRSSPQSQKVNEVRTPNLNTINTPKQPFSPKTPLQQTLSTPNSNSSSNILPNTFTFKPSADSSQVPTGSWEHPSIKEIRKRTVNKELVVSKVIKNIFILILLYGIEAVVKKFAYTVIPNPLVETTSLLHSTNIIDYIKYIQWIIYILCLYNITSGVSLLIKPEEKFDDLPITPSQRKLLGLPASPSSSMVSPSPPRYVKSSPQARVSPRNSPLSRTTPSKASPLSRVSGSNGNLMSPSPADKNINKTVSGSSNVISNNSTINSSTPTAKPSTISGNFGTTNTNLSSITKSANTSNTTTAPNTTSTPSKLASNTSAPFSPTGRYLYLSESSPRRRSGLARNI